MLFTKCILEEISPGDGLRVSVMSRHTKNNGRTRDRRIKEGMYHVHIKVLGPSPKLIGDYYKRGLQWNRFRDAYLREIRKSPGALFVELIAKLALTTNVTLLCIEDTPDFCHRRLLAEECRRYKPKLEIVHH